MSSSAERIDLRSIEPRPWKNGAGLTREIAVGPKGSGADDFGWRFSLAEVEHDAPFSAFPGIDRCIVLLQGAGMRLRSAAAGLDHRLDRKLAPFRFSGDTPLEATLIDGPCSDFNVMTRRGAWSCEVSVHLSDIAPATADITLLLCSAGEWHVTDPSPQALRPMQALLWRAPSPHISVQAARPNQADAILLVRLCHDRAP